MLIGNWFLRQGRALDHGGKEGQGTDAKITKTDKKSREKESQQAERVMATVRVVSGVEVFASKEL